MMKFMMPFLLLCLVFGMMSFPAHAYMGPGAGLTAFGCLVALLAGIWYTFKGFLWLPLKRKFGKKNASSGSSAHAAGQDDAKQTTLNTESNIESKAESKTGPEAEPNADKT